MTMTLAHAADVLKQHNAWRRGDAEDTPEGTNPKIVGQAIEAAIVSLQADAHERSHRQEDVAEWCAAAFGAGAAASLAQRGVRLAEEAIEAAQAAGVEPAMLHRLVDYVYARPVGELQQELGGVGVTLLALAAAAGLDADAAEEAEVTRVLAKPLAHFTARNAAKNLAGFDTAVAAA